VDEPTATEQGLAATRAAEQNPTWAEARANGEGAMELIGMLDSPYVRRVAIALIAAKVPFTHRPISLFRHIDAFSKINPLLKAPTLVADDGTVLMDSTLILDYLAAVYPRVAALRRCPKTIASFRETSARCCSSILDGMSLGSC